MLPRPNRLRRSADIQHVRRNGRRSYHPLLTLYVMNNDRANARFAISVSRRVGNAVVRNRAKRLVREAIHGQLSQLEAGWDCLFVASPEMATASFAEVQMAVNRLLLRANLLRQDNGMSGS